MEKKIKERRKTSFEKIKDKFEMKKQVEERTRITELSYEISKSLLPPERTFDNTPDNIWFVLINPERAIEVRAWLKNNKVKALIMRGEHGETMLHWAVLSEYGLIIDLVDAGISPNAKDKYGKTPMDWLLERYWYTSVEKRNIGMEGLAKIKGQTEDLGTVLWALGGRPSENNEEALNADIVAARGGLWWYLISKYDVYGVDAFRGWLKDKRSVMHVWILSENNTQKIERIKKFLEWGLSIDEIDANGRSPLWYAIDTWKNNLEIDLMIDLIPELLKLGADPDLSDNFDVSPRNILTDEKAFLFEEMIKENSIH